VNPRATLDADSLALWQSLGAKFVVVYRFGGRPNGAVARATPQGLIEAEDPDGSFHDWLRRSGAGQGSVAIVRPDRFVFALVPGAELSAATREFARQLHRDDADVEIAAAEKATPIHPHWAEAA